MNVENIVAQSMRQPQQVQVPMVMHSDKAGLEPRNENEVLLVRLTSDASDLCSECLQRLEAKLYEFYCESLTVLASGHILPHKAFIRSSGKTKKGGDVIHFRSDLMVAMFPGDSESLDSIDYAPLEDWMKIKPQSPNTSKSASTAESEEESESS
jgi:hypothetical protein